MDQLLLADVVIELCHGHLHVHAWRHIHSCYRVLCAKHHEEGACPVGDSLPGSVFMFLCSSFLVLLNCFKLSQW